MRSDPATGGLVVAGTAGAGDRDGDLAVWVPGADTPDIATSGLADTTVSPVDGGAYVTARPTDGAYRLEIAPAP